MTPTAPTAEKARTVINVVLVAIGASPGVGDLLPRDLSPFESLSRSTPRRTGSAVLLATTSDADRVLHPLIAVPVPQSHGPHSPVSWHAPQRQRVGQLVVPNATGQRDMRRPVPGLRMRQRTRRHVRPAHVVHFAL